MRMIKKELAAAKVVSLTVIAFGILLASDGPHAVFPDPSWNFGYLPQKAEVSHTFYVRNDGNAPLKVVKIELDCSCTSVSEIEKPIDPGDSAAIVLSFKTGRYHGRVTKSARVHTDDPVRPIQRVRFQSLVIKEDEPADSVAVLPLKLKWKLEESRLALKADTVRIVNTGSIDRKIVPLLVPHEIVESLDFPKTVAGGDSVAIAMKLAKDKIPSDMKYFSTTIAFEGRDTTIVTIPIELEE
jgi:hypothetical protein